MQKQGFFSLIQTNIDNYGYHITVVNGDITPRYAYTIGLKESLGLELVFAGGFYYDSNDLKTIFDGVIAHLKIKNNLLDKITVNSLGNFSLKTVDPSWTNPMLLGVIDFYRGEKINCLQILPDPAHFTLEIPDMSINRNSAAAPVWKWLTEEWDLPISKNSKVVTDIDVLKGTKATEVMRWEENQWEMFSGYGPDIPQENIRVVPMSTIIQLDKSLEPALLLEIGKGMWRDEDDTKWQPWG